MRLHEWGQIFILYNPKFRREVNHRLVARKKQNPISLLKMEFWSQHSGLPSVKGSKKAIVKIREAPMALLIYFGNPNSFPLPELK